MNLRRMNSRYRSKCKRCSARISVGSPIYWSKETGALCLDCGGQKSESPAPVKPEMPVKLDAPKAEASKEGYWRIDWADLRKFCQTVWKSGRIPAGFRNANERLLKRMLLDTDEYWQGHSRGQAERWLTEGYRTDALKGIQDFNPPIREKRRLQFDEDGDEFHLDLAISGDEKYMSQWSKREVIAGVKVTLEPWFSASCNAEVVNAFNAWTNKLIYALEAAGVDAEISYVFRGTSAHRPHYTEIRLKKENEISDFLGISPMLSPAAFRMLGHTALYLQAEAEKHDGDSGGSYGGGSSDWGVSVSEDGRGITVVTPRHDTRFPEDAMTGKLRLALKEIMSK